MAPIRICSHLGIPSVPAVPAVAPDPEPVKKALVPAPEFGSFTVEVSTKDTEDLGHWGGTLGIPIRD